MKKLFIWLYDLAQDFKETTSYIVKIIGWLSDSFGNIPEPPSAWRITVPTVGEDPEERDTSDSVQENTEGQTQKGGVQ